MEKEKKGEKEEKKFSWGRLVGAIFIVSLALTIAYIKFTDELKGLYHQVGPWGSLGLVLGFGGAFVSLIAFGNLKGEDSKSKIKIVLFLLISSITSFFFFNYLKNIITINLQTILLVIATSAFFGYITTYVTSLTAQWFSKISAWWKGKIWSLMFCFFIPMMFVIIIFMGALQAKFGYEETLIRDYKVNLEVAVAPAIINGFYNLLTQVYSTGREKPNLWLVICGLATFFLFTWAMIKPEEKEYELGAQELIDETSEDDLHKRDAKDIEMLLKGKMRPDVLKYMKEYRESKNFEAMYIVVGEKKK